MSKQLAIQVKQADVPVPIKASFSQEVFDHLHELHDDIARRAFETFERRGHEHGYDFDDWIKAEIECLHPVHLSMTQSDGAVTVRAEVPGFSAKDLKVGVDGHRLTISGKRETKEDGETNKSIYSERCSNEIFRAVELPPDADLASINATLDKGVLEVAMPKAGKK